jgi:hypothetical protein
MPGVWRFGQLRLASSGGLAVPPAFVSDGNRAVPRRLPGPDPASAAREESYQQTTVKSLIKLLIMHILTI